MPRQRERPEPRKPRQEPPRQEPVERDQRKETKDKRDKLKASKKPQQIGQGEQRAPRVRRGKNRNVVKPQTVYAPDPNYQPPPRSVPGVAGGNPAPRLGGGQRQALPPR
mmetsp:Transcript_65422/g.154557  ORF Transcript_65422/g.154557 Transcript_65422/m.154557 type:complete len:109 (+) Transcript_65422:109-435(+)